jgi:hypothetical protein
MTVVAFPLDAVSGSPAYPGRAIRETLGALLGGATTARPLGGFSGVRPGTSTTTVSLAGTTWTCATHAGVLDVEAAAEAGPYFYAVSVAESAVLNAANGSNPRIDILSVQLSDPAESDGTSVPKAELIYTAGTAAASPTVPATPARAMKIAQFAVPKTGAGSPTVTWVAPTLFAAGGRASVATVSALGALPVFNGMHADVDSTPGADWRYSSVTSSWVMDGVARFTDAAARTSALSSPVQGMRSKRADASFEERYFELYNAGTNPTGASAAGWYQVGRGTNGAGQISLADTDWINMTLSSGWSVTAGLTPQYRRFAGVVYIRGRATYSSGGSTTVAVLPAGFRIGQVLRRAVSDGSSGTSTSLLVIDTNGELRVSSTTQIPNFDGSYIAEA